MSNQYSSDNQAPAAQELRQSYDWCRAVTKKRARNFYYAIRMLPAERRDAMCAVYSFFRACDDLSDDEKICNRQQSLEKWRRLLYETPSNFNFPGLAAFYHATATYGIPVKPYSDLIDGTLTDLTPHHYQTFAETYQYCYRVASTVGIVCVHIFGFDNSPEALKMAEYEGIAFQLTNILRDIAEDCAMGRVYLPEEILGEFGLSAATLSEFCRRLNGCTELPQDETEMVAKIDALVKHMVSRAQNYYELAGDLPKHINPVSRPALQAMAGIYHGILRKASQLGARVLVKRARLSTWEKLLIVGKSFLLSYWAKLLQDISDLFNNPSHESVPPQV